MPDTHSDFDSGSHSTAKRSLPSWMNSIENRNKSQKKQVNANEIFLCNDKDNRTDISYDVNQNTEFSKLLEGVVFALSGFVNPERSTLREQALEMGAEYQPDWNSDCTLLICAFPNTPKFRQVETDFGTIVSKEWISKCYNHKKLVDIELYLMHAGKPWRKCVLQKQLKKDQGSALFEEPIQKMGKRSLAMAGSASEGGLSGSINHFLPPKIKQWAADDLSMALSWLEGQAEKPEVTEIKGIAAEGILTCLQDAMDSLKQNNDIKMVTEQWMFVPRIVTFLAELESGNRNGSVLKKDLYELVDSCKKIYQEELKQLVGSSSIGKCEIDQDREEDVAELDEEGFDSDRTIEMTQEEIDFACKQFGC